MESRRGWMWVARWTAIGLLLGGISLLLAACAGKQGQIASPTRQSANSTTGKVEAPDFTLSSVAGKSVSLSAYRGKVVVLDFWATWCPPCREALPHTQALSESPEAQDGKLVVLTVNAREDQATIKSFLKANRYTFTVLRDADGAVMDKYGVQGIPTFVVIDRSGNIAWRSEGFDGEGLKNAVSAALSS